MSEAFVLSDMGCFLSESYSYLVRLLREEVLQAQSEVDRLRSSLRYRAGSLLIESFPPSIRSIRAFRDLLFLLVSHARKRRVAGDTCSSCCVPEVALNASCLVLASSPCSVSDLDGVWITTDADLFAAVMDAVHAPSIVVLHKLDQVVVRRLARWQVLGGRVDWHPLPGTNHSPVLLSYLQSLLINPVDSRV